MYFILLMIISSFLFFSCASSTIEGSDHFKISEESILDGQECEDPDISCDALSYFVYEAYSNSYFERAVENADEAIACGCGSSNATDIYNFLARSYVELGEDSKATESIEKGLMYDSDNIKMIELAIWNARRLNDRDEEIMYLENLLLLKKDTNINKKEDNLVNNSILDLFVEAAAIDGNIENNPTKASGYKALKTVY